MEENIPPSDWRPPQWHADFGNPMLQLEPLKAFAGRLMLAEPKTILTLEAPEPGLLYVRGEFPNEKVFEVYSVPSLEHSGTRRLAVFVNPDTGEEVEKYFDLVDEAIEFIVTQRSKACG